MQRTVINSADGERGFFSGSALVFAKPGSNLMDLDEGALAAIEEHPDLKLAKALDADDGPVSLAGKNKADLLAIAAAEGAEIEDGATNADITSAIELHREAASKN